MTRVQASENLKAIGIEEPTEEQISNYLDQLGGETKREKDRAEKYKADANRVAELEKQLEDINNQNLSDVEKAQKETAVAKEQIADLQKKIKSMETRTALAELGIVGEQAEKLINEDGAVDFAVLGQIISERETKAKSLKEKELLAGTPNPEGEGGNSDDADKLSEAESFAKDIGKTFADNNKTANDVLAQYTNL